MPVSTRGSVLGKRRVRSELSSPSSSSVNELDECGLLTPDSTPSAKRVKTASPATDDGSNKENIPPFKMEVVNASPSNIRTPRALRRMSTAPDVSPSRRTPRRNASTSNSRTIPTTVTPATSLSGLSLTTPPPSPPSILLPINARARALLRVTTNNAGTITGREKERDVIQGFVRSLLGPNPAIEKPSLYISGSPGSGKTALVTVILHELSSELAQSDTAVITLNCMALASVDGLWARLVEVFEEHPAKARSKPKSKPDECFRCLLTGSSRKYVLLLDELDNVASSAQSLTTLFNAVRKYSSQIRLIGIANTHTLTSISSSHSTASMSVETLHFTPYSSQQLLGVLRSRLSPLASAEHAESLEKFLPPSTLNLLSKRVAALTGDVRVVFEVLRRAIDLATSVDLALDSPTPSVTPSHVLQALKAFSQTPTSVPAISTSHASTPSKKASDSEIVAKVEGLGLQARLALLSLLLSHHRVQTGITTSGPSTPTTPRKSGKSLPARSVASTSISIEESHLYGYYTSLLERSENQIFRPVSRSEFSDLIGILETVGLVTTSTTGKLPGSPSKSGRRCHLKSTTFGGGAGQPGGRELQFVAGLRIEEVSKGLGILSSPEGEATDIKEEEVRSIWRKESSVIAKEAKFRREVEPLCG